MRRGKEKKEKTLTFEVTIITKDDEITKEWIFSRLASFLGPTTSLTITTGVTTWTTTDANYVVSVS